jgi:hypothetical protein
MGVFPAGCTSRAGRHSLARDLPVPLVWNDLLVALVFGFTIRRRVRAQGTDALFSSNIDAIGPGSLLSMLVLLIMFFTFQRYFAQGVPSGSLCSPLHPISRSIVDGCCPIRVFVR